MFFIIAAVIDDNARGLAAPRQGEGKGQGDSVKVKSAGWLFHDSPFLSGVSDE
jgi:hypothetical protein